MSLVIRLLGRPRIDGSGPASYKFRSRKSWAVLAYLVLSKRPPSRSQLASLLFADADDPLRALRWSLAEIRRCLGDNGSVDGDPVVLQLSTDTVIDARVVASGSWVDALDVPGLGADLLDGIAIAGAAAFESWLLSERRHLAAASEAILHEAALGSMSHGALDTARDLAVRAVAMSPLDETHQALLIRLYRLAGDDNAAETQYTTCAALFDRELKAKPGPAVEAAMRERRPEPEPISDDASIAAVVEAGSAAVSAGAVEAGVTSLRAAVRLADRAESVELRLSSRLVLAEALIHSLGGLDEEGLATLHDADRIAFAEGDRLAAAQARAELGYVDYLRARYDRANRWLTDALELGQSSAATMAKATTYLGSVDSDRGEYPRAIARLTQATTLSRISGDLRREAYALSMLGRISYLRGDLDSAADHLDAAMNLASRDHWLSFLPWPQALQGHVYLARDDVPRASATLEQAFARACQIGDPCWEGMAARGLALVAEASGDTTRALEILFNARFRCNRLAEPYVWLDVYILDALCTLGRRHKHPETGQWVDTMRKLASRTGMKELTIRSMLHAAALGNDGDAAAAALLAGDVDNPILDQLLRKSPSPTAVQTERAPPATRLTRDRTFGR